LEFYFYAYGESNELLNKFDDIINFSLGDPDFNTAEAIIDLAMIDAKMGIPLYRCFWRSRIRDEIIKYYKDEFGLDVNEKR